MRARSATSCRVDSRYSSVRGSWTMMPALKLVKPTRPLSSTTSLAGARPQRRTLPGAERTASSTTCGGILTTFFSRSTLQPPSAKMSRASSPSTNTPVRSSTSSVARWRSSRSLSEKTSRRRAALRRAPACRLRFIGSTPRRAVARRAAVPGHRARALHRLHRARPRGAGRGPPTREMLRDAGRSCRTAAVTRQPILRPDPCRGATRDRPARERCRSGRPPARHQFRPARSRPRHGCRVDHCRGSTAVPTAAGYVDLADERSVRAR